MRPILSLGLVALIAFGQTPVTALADEAAAAETAPAAAPVTLPAITVFAVKPMTLSDRIIASGLIAAVEEVQVVPLIEGQPLDNLLADVGDRVEAGQVLAKLSNSTLELQKTEALAALASARSPAEDGRTLPCPNRSESAGRRCDRRPECQAWRSGHSGGSADVPHHPRRCA